MSCKAILWPALAAVSMGACTAIPEIASDYEYPSQEILRYAVCELRDAYTELDDKRLYPHFHAQNYSIKIALQPKVDREFSARVGMTGKSTNLTKRYSDSWIGGAFPGGGAPGAGVTVRGHQDGTVGFVIKSVNLLAKTFVMNCDTDWSPAKHALAQNLGIRSWLLRSTLAAQPHDIQKVTDVDSHSFQAEIYVKFDGAGQFTYLFPLGTDYASLGAQNYTDQFLTITITYDPPKKPIRVQTIPGTLSEGGEFKSIAAASPRAVSPDARTRLDLLQLQQTLGNLQVRVTQ